MLELYRRLISDQSANRYWNLKWESKSTGIPVEQIEKILSNYNSLLRVTRNIPYSIFDNGTSYDEDDGTSGVTSHIIEFKYAPVSTEAVRLLADELWPHTFCTHEYDCCGHWYSDWPRVEILNPRLYKVTQRVYQNV